MTEEQERPDSSVEVVPYREEWLDVAEKEIWVDAALASLRADGPTTSPVYDRIGAGYAGQRVPEPTWAALITAALGDASSVLNVGAGTGNYEPPDLLVTALEPSSTMLAQRSRVHPMVQGEAERLPFVDDQFDAALAIFTVHHWVDRTRGLKELRRVSRRQVLVVYEPLAAHRFWLVDYFPEIPMATTEANGPTPADLAKHLDIVHVQTMWIPADCSDGVAAAYWRRPEAYLDTTVQRSMSILALLPDDVVARGAARLAQDLDDGTWFARNGHLLHQDKADYGYRLVVAKS
ncbi:MAG: class I SAM-dependent methyltransferase [Aquihabitans sp.]